LGWSSFSPIPFSVGENRIGFHVGVGNLQGHHLVIAQIGGAEDRRHAAAGYGRVYAIGIYLRTGFQNVEYPHRYGVLRAYFPLPLYLETRRGD
jgi:hypothetical protein